MIPNDVVRLLLGGFLMASAVAGQENGVFFIYPTDNQIYNTMDTINVTYTSPFPTPNLYLWCSGHDDPSTSYRVKPFQRCRG